MINVTYKAAFVDLDGVLADTFIMHVNGWEEVLRFYGVSDLELDYERLKGIETRAALKYLSEAAGLSEEFDFDLAESIKNESKKRWLRSIDSSIVNYEAVEFVRRIKAQGAYLCCFATTRSVSHILRALDLFKMFDEVVCSSDIASRKVDAVSVVVENVATESGADRAEMIALDDSHEVCKKFRELGVQTRCHCARSDCIEGRSRGIKVLRSTA